MSVTPGNHILGEFVGDKLGVSVIIFGGIHGNEQSGITAMKRMIPRLAELEETLKGRVYLIAGNTRALQKDIRYIDSDLNRQWTDEIAHRNSPRSQINTNRIEDKEQREMLLILNRILASAKNEVFALDLHSTSAESVPFAMIGDTLRNRAFGQKFPATILLGIEEQLDGTILEFMNNLGAVTLGFEAGQHTTRAAIDNQEAFSWLALINSGVLDEKHVSRRKYETVLRNALGKQRLIEIRHRHGIKPSDEFKMEPGYTNFQPVKEGEVLASDKNRKITAVESGLILMPLYQAQGEDGFFIGRQISPFWLWLSGVLRFFKIGELMTIFPGVKRHPEDPDSLIVNTNVARILPLQIFHLLGFRKRRWRNEKLVVSRRRHDTKSPFKKK